MDEQRAEDRDKALAGIDIGKRHDWVWSSLPIPVITA
jgi:hypothetical protein